MPKRNRSKKNVLKNISDASMKKLNELKKKLLQGGEGEGVENASMGAATGVTTKVDSVGRPEPVAEDLRDTGAMAIQPAESVVDNAQAVTSDASATGAAATGAQSERSISNLWGLLSGGKSKRRNRNNSKRNRSQRNRKQNSKKRN